MMKRQKWDRLEKSTRPWLIGWRSRQTERSVRINAWMPEGTGLRLRDAMEGEAQAF